MRWIIWFSVDSDALYSVLIFICFRLQESDAGFGICEFKFRKEVLFIRLDINSNSSDYVSFHKYRNYSNLVTTAHSINGKNKTFYRCAPKLEPILINAH